MKFTCAREQLDKQIQHVARVVTVRTSMPILSNLLLETDKDKLRISGTDLELAIATQVKAKISQEGSFTVPAKLFQDFIHQNPDEEIDFELRSNELVCKSAQVEARIPGIDPDEYPALPQVKEKGVVQVDAERFINALKQVSIACATDMGRPVLTGVKCVIGEDAVIVVATDSFRLAERTLPGSAVKGEETLLIPLRTVQELIRVAGQLEGKGDLSITLGDQQVVLRLGDVEFYSRLLSGAFPKYQAIIPTVFVAEAVVSGSDLVQALRLATIFSQSGVANVALDVTEEGTLVVSSYGLQRGAATNVVAATINKGYKSVRAAFNARFLIDACTSAGSGDLTLRFSGSSTPLVIANDDPSYMQLVMPIRLDV